MDLKKLFSKKEMRRPPATDDEFKKMSKAQKKKLMSNDLSERLIRVEQRVSAKFAKPVPYNKTEYYKSLTPYQKKSFEKYLKNKNRKKVMGLFALLLPVLVLGFFNFSITGNVISEEVAKQGFNLTLILLGLFVFLFLIFAGIFLMKKNKKDKFKRYFDVIDDIVYGRG